MQVKFMIILVAATVALAGCNHNQSVPAANVEPIETPIVTPTPVEPATTRPTVRKIKRQPSTTQTEASIAPESAPTQELVPTQTVTTPEVKRPVVQSKISNWQPNEASLFRGKELINGLQRELGRQPNQAEMQKRLQTHMGLSAVQANKLVAALGLH